MYGPKYGRISRCIDVHFTWRQAPSALPPALHMHTPCKVRHIYETPPPTRPIHDCPLESATGVSEPLGCERPCSYQLGMLKRSRLQSENRPTFRPPESTPPPHVASFVMLYYEGVSVVDQANRSLANTPEVPPYFTFPRTHKMLVLVKLS